MHQNSESNRLLVDDAARAGPTSLMEVASDGAGAQESYPKAEPIARLKILANIGGLLRWSFSCAITGTGAAVSARAAGEPILPIPAYIAACVSCPPNLKPSVEYQVDRLI